MLSVSAEREQINLRFLTAPPPAKGQTISLYPPRYLEALKDIWESPLFANASLGWLQNVSKLQFAPLPDCDVIAGFPALRARQRQAFGLLDREFGFLWGPPGTGKTHTVGAMLAHYLHQNPLRKILLLSTTNSAVDLALISVDVRLEELSRKFPAADALRRKCKRIGNHFLARLYKDREHLLPAIDSQLVKRIAQLETEMPDKNDVAKYAQWKDQIAALRAQIPKPIDQAQIAAMTTTGAAFSFGALMDRKPFDLVVFDEASQVSLPHALALAPLGRRVLFAGDHKQLAPIFLSDHPDVKKCLGVSMFQLMNSGNRCFLNEQSRMVEEICDIISHVFYDGNLVVAQECDKDPEWRARRRVSFVSGMGTKRVHLEQCPEEGSFKQTKYGIGTRYKSAEYISRVVPHLSAIASQEEILVLTPYRAQRGLIKTFLKNAGQKKTNVSTVHRAQGSEYHTVIFDPVIAAGDKLLGHPEEGPRLINVALSRAKARLIIIMSKGDCANEYLRRIAHAISGEGQFDGAIPLHEIATLDGFPSKFFGRIVRWQQYVGPIEQHEVPDSFYINDFVTGQRKPIKTAIVREICRRAASTSAEDAIEN